MENPWYYGALQVANMVANMVAEMVADMVTDMVADMEVDKLADMVAINVGHMAWAPEGRERRSQAGQRAQSRPKDFLWQIFYIIA